MLKPFLLAVALAALTSPALAEDIITGSALYREKIAMPGNAVFEAELVERLSGSVIASMRRENAGNPPYRISIGYDPAKIEDKLGYGVRASIIVDGKAMFSTADMPDVITRGAPREVTIIMRMAR
jgi:uncharacterized lipoprotein YbaY